MTIEIFRQREESIRAVRRALGDIGYIESIVMPGYTGFPSLSRDRLIHVNFDTYVGITYGKEDLSKASSWCGVEYIFILGREFPRHLRLDSVSGALSDANLKFGSNFMYSYSGGITFLHLRDRLELADPDVATKSIDARVSEVYEILEDNGLIHAK